MASKSKTLARPTLALACVGLAVAASSGAGRTQEPFGYATGLVQVDDAAYAAIPTVRRFRSFLPQSVDLTDRFPTPGHQHQQGSCAAWAVAYAARSFLSVRETGQPIGGPETIASPAYIFNTLRTDPQCRRGSSIKAALDLLQREGASDLRSFPYVETSCEAIPSAEIRALAGRFRLAGYRKVERIKSAQANDSRDFRDPVVLDDIKGALARKNPVVFGMKVPADFGRGMDGFKGVYRSTERVDKWGGEAAGHAMALVGYDDGRQAFRLINSWGTRWGDGGYLWVDYETFRNLVGEAYVLEPAKLAAEAQVAPPPVQLPVLERLKRAVPLPDCGRLTVTEQGGRRVVSGFGGDAAQLAQFRAQAQAVDPQVQWAVRHRPFPQCEAELSLEQALADPGARLTLARENGPVLTEDQAALREDEIFTVEVETTPARPFVHVVYIDAEGSATELYRGAPQAGGDGRRRIKVGAAGGKEVRFQVAPPFGHEVVVALASDRALFGPTLSNYRTEREFLTAMRTALVNARQANRPVSAAVRPVITKAKG